MEVLLNATWLLVAIAAFLLWYPREHSGARANREKNQNFALLALSVALILLFPVISLTDDLHAEQAAMEDSSRSVIKARNMVQACLRAGSSSMAVVPPAPFSIAGLYLFSGLAAPVETRLLCLTLVSTHEGRAPPSEV